MKMKSFKAYLKTYIWLLIMTYLLFSPSSGLPKGGHINIPHADKAVHLAMFGILSFVYLFDSFRYRRKYRKTILNITLICVLIGISSELIQHAFIPGRNGNIYDFLADIIGLLLGIAIFGLIRKHYLNG
jgi:VanZ family protein